MTWAEVKKETVFLLWEFYKQRITPEIHSCGTLIPVMQCFPDRFLLSTPWDGGQVSGNEGSSHSRHCPETKQADHVLFIIAAGALLFWTQSVLVRGSFPVETNACFTDAQLLTESVLGRAGKSPCPGIRANAKPWSLKSSGQASHFSQSLAGFHRTQKSCSPCLESHSYSPV